MRRIIRLYSFCAAFLIAAVVFAVNARLERTTKERFTEAVYHRAFSELVDSMSNLQFALQKAEYVTSPVQLVALSNTIYRQSGNAKANIGQLPVTNINLDRMQKFLAQTSDYIYLLTKKTVSDETITPEERSTIAMLNEYAFRLCEQLRYMQDSIYKSKDKIHAVEALLNNEAMDTTLKERKTNSIEKLFSDYPKLIYDGPFSESINTSHSYFLLQNAHPFTDANARVYMKDKLSLTASIVCDKQTQIEPTIMRYLCGNAYVDFTKQGGYLLRMSIDRYVTDSFMEEKECLEHTDAFLKKVGYLNFVQTYSIEEEGMLTVNYALQEDSPHGKIICYPDLIKVGAAMDSGKICFFDAEGYLKNHVPVSERAIPDVILTQEQAIAKINPLLTVGNVRLAFIPTDSGATRLCYEIQCTNTEGMHFLSYINAETGMEEDFLVLLDTGHGTLTF